MDPCSNLPFSTSSTIRLVKSTSIPGIASRVITSTAACATTPEKGTYCGFIKPEDPCAPQPDGYGPVPNPDTVSAFLAYRPFATMASLAPTPQNYTNAFINAAGSIKISSYLGMYDLTSYSTMACAEHCTNTELCISFNIYVERDPSQAPSANDSTASSVWGHWCPDPPAITNFTCTLWGSVISATTATNTGECGEQFRVAITASNGYIFTRISHHQPSPQTRLHSIAQGGLLVEPMTLHPWINYTA
jgi:hypothetical protein